MSDAEEKQQHLLRCKALVQLYKDPSSAGKMAVLKCLSLRQNKGPLQLPILQPQSKRSHHSQRQEQICYHKTAERLCLVAHASKSALGRQSSRPGGWMALWLKHMLPSLTTGVWTRDPRGRGENHQPVGVLWQSHAYHIPECSAHSILNVTH